MKIFALLMPDVMQMYTKSKSMVCKVDKKKCQLLLVCYDLLSYVDEWEAQACGQSRWLFDYQMFS